MRPSAVAWLAVVLLLGACGSPAEMSSAAPSAPTASGLDPGQLGLTCGGERFHPALLAATGSAETESDPAAAALRSWLAELEGRNLVPSSGWVRIANLAAAAEFIAPTTDPAEYAYVAFVVRGGEVVLGDGDGRCRPEIVLGPNVSRAELRLDPAFPAPAAAATTVHLLINERACSGGQSPEGRVEPPIVTVTAEAVIIAVLVREIPGGNDCPGNPDFAITVELPEPLGERQLLDGAVFPPAPIVDLDAAGRANGIDVSCGTVGRADCAAMADELSEVYEREHEKQVSEIEIREPGNYTITFADGSWVTMTSN